MVQMATSSTTAFLMFAVAERRTGTVEWSLNLRHHSSPAVRSVTSQVAAELAAELIAVRRMWAMAIHGFRVSWVLHETIWNNGWFWCWDFAQWYNVETRWLWILVTAGSHTKVWYQCHLLGESVLNCSVLILKDALYAFLTVFAWCLCEPLKNSLVDWLI